MTVNLASSIHQAGMAGRTTPDHPAHPSLCHPPPPSIHLQEFAFYHFLLFFTVFPIFFQLFPVASLYHSSMLFLPFTLTPLPLLPTLSLSTTETV